MGLDSVEAIKKYSLNTQTFPLYSEAFMFQNYINIKMDGMFNYIMHNFVNGWFGILWSVGRISLLLLPRLSKIPSKCYSNGLNTFGYLGSNKEIQPDATSGGLQYWSVQFLKLCPILLHVRLWTKLDGQYTHLFTVTPVSKVEFSKTYTQYGMAQEAQVLCGGDDMRGSAETTFAYGCYTWKESEKKYSLLMVGRTTLQEIGV